jgi:hypothetical protein
MSLIAQGKLRIIPMQLIVHGDAFIHRFIHGWTAIYGMKIQSISYVWVVEALNPTARPLLSHYYKIDLSVFLIFDDFHIKSSKAIKASRQIHKSSLKRYQNKTPKPITL